MSGNHRTCDGPRLALEIQRQLDELVEIRRDFESASDFSYVGEKHLASLVAHEQELQRELAVAREWEQRTANGHE